MSLGDKPQIVLDTLPNKGTIEMAPNAESDAVQFSEFNTSMSRRDMGAESGDEGGLSMNPVSLNTRSGIIKMTTNLGFKNLTCQANCADNSVEWKFEDSIRSVPAGELQNAIRKYNPGFAVPLSMKVLGTSLGDLENYFALQVFDKSPSKKALHSVTGFKMNASDKVHLSGYPLYLMKSGQNRVLLKSGTFNSEHLSYWSLNMNMLDDPEAVLKVSMPGKSYSDVLVRRDSQAARMANYALSVKNHVVTPPLLENPSFEYALDKDFIVMPSGLFNDVKEAYHNKFEQVKDESYDFSSIVFNLVPLPGVPESMLQGVENAYISLEITAQMGMDANKTHHKSRAASERLSNGLFETRPVLDAQMTDI